MSNPRFSIRAKLLIAFVGLSLLPMLFVSGYGLYQNERTMRRLALEDLRHDVSAIRGRTANFLTGVEGDIRVLLNSSTLQRYMALRAPRGGADARRLLRAAAEEILAFAKTKKVYYQIRLLGPGQEELLRIECDDIIDSAAHCRIVSPAELSQGGATYYAFLAKGLPPGQIAFFPAELVFRKTRRLPSVSFVTALGGGLPRGGLLVANVFAGNLFREIEAQRSTAMNGNVVLVESDGHFLYDSEERNDWNRLIATREEANLQKEYGEQIADEILSGREGMITEGSDDIIAYAPLLRAAPQTEPGVIPPGVTSSLFVFESVPGGRITSEARSSALTFALLFIAFLAAAVTLGLLATGQFTRPISEVRRGAEIISRGNYRHRLSVRTGDEIEELARQFNLMAASLDEHEQAIQEHRNRLEEMVEDRTAELVGEKGKLQAILDNVPSAFLMSDPEWRIAAASAAFTGITGLELEKVRGRDSREVFREGGLCRWEKGEDGAGPEAVEMHVDKVAGSGGAERYLEHVIIPMTDKGGSGSILQIITDITKRKELEEHLIRSEKLMATGEMAAIIAHGFRNSLTSIKMILQLQQESGRQGRMDRKSLQVALDSIFRMEGVVQDLLHFARPTPLVFRPADLNACLEESIALLLPRLREQRIALRKHTDGRLPLLSLAVQEMRDALVNILLNAAQAIEEKGRGRGVIDVATRRRMLARTLRELQTPAWRRGSGDGRDIVLRKGTECVALTVRDNGPGMDRSTLARIFDPFFTTKASGTGLGLPMVMRTVSAHGGLLFLRSRRGRGTSIEIILPVRAGLPFAPADKEGADEI